MHERRSFKMNSIDWVARVLVIVGALNWGLAVFDFNLVTALFGSWPVVVKIIYALVGLAAIWELVALFKN